MPRCQFLVALLLLAPDTPTVKAQPPKEEPAGLIRRFGSSKLPGSHVADFDLTPDRKKLVLARGDGLSVWDVARWRRLFCIPYTRPFGLSQVRFSLNGNYVAGLDWKHGLHIYDCTRRRQLLQLPPVPGVYNTLALSREGKVLAAGTRDGELFFWSIPDGNKLPGARRLVKMPPPKPAPPKAKVRYKAIQSLAFSPDGKYLLVGNHSGPLLLLDTKTWKEERRYEFLPFRVAGVVFSPDGQRLLGCGTLEKGNKRSGGEGVRRWHGEESRPGSRRRASDSLPIRPVARMCSFISRKSRTWSLLK